MKFYACKYFFQCYFHCGICCVNLNFVFCKFHEFDQNWKRGDNSNINWYEQNKNSVYHADTMIITFCSLMYYEIFTDFALFEKNITNCLKNHLSGGHFEFFMVNLNIKIQSDIII